MLARDLMHGYGRQGGPPRCALKVDIQKAYDTVDWGFLRSILTGFGFHYIMIGWIMECVMTLSYSIVVNGDPYGRFDVKRGLRQGDPLSLYLFTLVMEILSLMLAHRARSNVFFKFHRWCKGLQITHLCFADDLILFCYGNVTSVESLKGAMDDFSKISGLSPSIEKSTAFFGNVPDATKNDILDILPFQEGTLPVKYLGIPLIGSSLKHSDCRPLIEKVRGRINNWKNRWLSFAGRLHLIQSVLGSLSVFWSSVLFLPANTVHEIEKLIRWFLWCQGELKKGKAKVAWAEVCLPKSHGGLGIRKLGPWNIALISKHVWDVLQQKDLLWVQWIHKELLKGSSIWDVTVPQLCSWNWKKMLGLRDLLRNHFKFVIGNGQITMAWSDIWLLSVPLCSKLSQMQIRDAGFGPNDKVADVWRNGGWAWPSAWYGHILPFNANIVPIVCGTGPDKVEWLNSSGNLVAFSTCAVWKTLRPSAVEVAWHKVVWHKNKIPKHSFISWLVFRNALLTQQRIMAWKEDPPDLVCAFCKTVPDSRSHLLFECGYSRQVWGLFKELSDGNEMGYMWEDVTGFFDANVGNGTAKLNLLYMGFNAVIYHLWLERNSRLHNKGSRPVQDVFKTIYEEVHEILIHAKIRCKLPDSIQRLWNVSWGQQIERPEPSFDASKRDAG